MALQGALVFAMCLLSGALVLVAYRLGVIDGQRLARGGDITFAPADDPPEPSEQDAKLQALLKNIDAYDGTERGQVKL